MRSPRSAGASLLFAGSLVVSLALVEVFLRSSYPCPWYGYHLSSWWVGTLEHHELFGWKGRAKIHESFASFDFRVEVTHDARGNRSTADPYAPGKRNFVALGDSHAWGWGVANHEIYTERMMQRDPSLNVYNLGVPAYGPDQSYLRLQDLLERHPDARLEGAFLLLVENDFIGIRGRGGERMRKPIFHLEGDQLVLHGVPVEDAWAEDLDGPRVLEDPSPQPWRRLHLVNLVDRGIGPLLRGHKNTKFRTRDDYASSLDLLVRIIAAIADTAQQRGGHLHVVLHTVTERPPWRQLASELNRRDISAHFFRRRAIPQTNLWRDGHLSATGHDLLAEQMLAVIGG